MFPVKREEEILMERISETLDVRQRRGHTEFFVIQCPSIVLVSRFMIARTSLRLSSGRFRGRLGWVTEGLRSDQIQPLFNFRALAILTKPRTSLGRSHACFDFRSQPKLSC